jgi:hypothetical protein
MSHIRTLIIAGLAAAAPSALWVTGASAFNPQPEPPKTVQGDGSVRTHFGDGNTKAQDFHFRGSDKSLNFSNTAQGVDKGLNFSNRAQDFHRQELNFSK